MKPYATTIVNALLIILCASCAERHFITDDTERAAITADFEERRMSLPDGFFDFIDTDDLTVEQREAMVFLYAYMPLSDIADHSSGYFLDNVDYAFKARNEMPWGKDVPKREFKHFVLPVRVNNENLDSCRRVFYEELKERVCGLSMYDAVLEVNHWCHEKVTYRPSDSRTSSPLASVKTAYGRCGEESTFTVAALRAVGIPARQVYTPRWAHTDDNHAWVEAWVDGKWYFLGACEPEPMLNLAWFNAPASRGMLMHTKVFGRYSGPEEVMYRTPRYTEINVIDNYAPTARVDVTVCDIEGNPLEKAKVEFKLYNYGEFYSVATKETDSDGHTFLTAGKGDMIVWASKDGWYGYAHVSFGKDSNVNISLTKSGSNNECVDFDIVPPVENVVMPEVTAEQRADNDIRFAREDSIRRAYEATFYTEEMGMKFADTHNLTPAGTVAALLVASRGNHGVITSFLASLGDESRKRQGIDLLQSVSEKDLRDVSLDVLNDHLLNSRECGNPELQVRYVNNPRVSNEMLTPYKAFFNESVPEQLQNDFRADPMKLVKWVADSITVDAVCNLGGAPITPIGVWKARTANAHSRNIFFVSLARSMGIPARIDEVTGKVQLVNESGTVDVNFESAGQVNVPTGRLTAKYSPIKSLDDPKYYYHFTISQITDDGTLRLLEYDDGDNGTWSALLKNGLVLDSGNYLMVSGTRLASGEVLSHLAFFEIRPNKTTTVNLVMRESLDDVQVIGNFDSESLYMPADSDMPPGSILSATGRGYFIVGVIGVGQEPTNHALRDIAAYGKELEQWGRGMILLFPNEEQFKKFNPDEFPGLPSTITYGIDIDNAVQRQIIENMKLKQGGSTLPLFIIGDTFNRVVFVSQGYTIGLGEQLVKVTHKLPNM